MAVCIFWTGECEGRGEDFRQGGMGLGERTFPPPSKETSHRSNPSAPRWTDPGDLWAPNPNAISWKRKVEQIVEEAQSLKDSLDRYDARNQKRATEARERAELLGRANGDGAHVMRIFDKEAQARDLVRNSALMFEETNATGEAILRKYAEQREFLKRAQRKALDVLNTVGLSNSVLKLIERRNRVDQWIKYAGMILTVVVLFLIWRWRR